MGEADLHERMLDMDYGPHTDLERLAYYALPDMDGLDTPRGGKAVRAIAERHNPALVIIDTVTTGVVGPENDSDTYHAFWRHTGSPLKDRGVTVWRLDHAGKDLTKGQRGSSAKAGDTDVVWELDQTVPGELRLKATHRRMSWVPHLIDLVRLDGPTRHEITAGRGWPTGTHEAAIELDRHDAPIDITRRAAGKLLRGNGWSGRDEAVLGAIRWRKHHGAETPEPPGTTNGKTPGQNVVTPTHPLKGVGGHGATHEDDGRW